MKRAILIAVILAMVLAAGGAHAAWDLYLDGSALPVIDDNPWSEWNDSGNVVTTGTESGTTYMRFVAGADTDNEYYSSAVQINPVVAAGRFRLASYSTTGQKDLLCVIPEVDGHNPASASITLDDNRFKLWNFAGGGAVADIAAADSNWHTAYILVDNTNVKVLWDGVEVYNGLSPTVTSSGAGLEGADLEFGSGSWQMSAAATVDFDWVGFGDATNMPVPEPSSLLALGTMGLGAFGLMRRRRA